MLRLTFPLDPKAGLPAWWQPLLRSTGNLSVFLSTAWMQAWLQTFGTDFGGMWVCWEHNGEVIAGCLLLERVKWVRGLPMRTLYLNSTGESPRPTPFAEYNDIVCALNHRDAVAANLHEFLKSRPWSRLMLSGYERDGVSARLTQLIESAAVEHLEKPARFVDMVSLGDAPFEQSIKGKHGTYIRRNNRWFSECYGDVKVSRAETLEEARHFFSELRKLHLVRFQARGESSSLGDDCVVAFHHRLIADLWSSGSIDIMRVGSHETPIGYLYNFVVGSKVFVFQTGFAYEPNTKWSPGLLSHALAIESYRLRGGIREYDLLSGDALYKRTLAGSSHDLIWTTVYRDSWALSALLQVRRLLKRASERLRPVCASA